MLAFRLDKELEEAPERAKKVIKLSFAQFSNETMHNSLYSKFPCHYFIQKSLRRKAARRKAFWKRIEVNFRDQFIQTNSCVS